MISEKKIISSYKKFADVIDSRVQGYLKRSNIPAFSGMLKKMTMDTFFYNYDYIESIIGNNMVFLNDLVYTVLVEHLADSVYAAINPREGEKDSAKMGWWTHSTIVDIIRRNSTFCQAGDEEAWYYVSYGFAQIDQETLEDLIENSTDSDSKVRLMKFTDFSYDKFNLVTSQIVTNTVNTINQMMMNMWPSVMYDADNKIDDKLQQMFYECVDKVDTDAIQSDDIEEVHIQQFMQACTLFASSVMVNGGISLNAVQGVLSKTRFIWADEEVKKGKAKVPGTTMMYRLDYSEDDINFTVTITNSLIEKCISDRDNLNKTETFELQRKLRRMVNDYCAYIFAAGAVIEFEVEEN